MYAKVLPLTVKKWLPVGKLNVISIRQFSCEILFNRLLGKLFEFDINLLKFLL